MSKVRLIKILQCLALCFYCVSAIAHPSKRIVLISSNSHFGLVHRIEALLYAQPNIEPELYHHVVDASLADIDPKQLEKADLIVTVGTQALATTLASETTIPIFSILIREYAFHQMLAEHKRFLNDPHAPISALYLDHSFERQFELIKTLIPAKQSIPVGVLLQSRSTPNAINLYQNNLPKGITLITSHTTAHENPSEALEMLLEESRVLLALPDTTIYNAKSARGILLTAYHKRVPVIAYSRTFVNNGALAAVYSTPKQIADQTTQIMATILRSEHCTLPKPLHPEAFSVAINYQVANTLGLLLPNEIQVQKMIQEKSGNADALSS